MEDSKVMVFGSFTEDEIRALKKGPPESTVKPLEKSELQFGSLDVATIRSLSSLNAEPRKTDSSEGSKITQRTKLVIEESALKTSKPKNDVAQRVPVRAEENGNTPSFLHYPPYGNGVVELKRTSDKLTSLSISDNKAGPQKQSTHPNTCDIESGKSADISKSSLDSKTIYSPAVEDSKEDIQRTPNGPASAVKYLLPRGLINSGNICFLNAALQALLSCSPFVQLLQELRSRDIPKTGFPTLCAFVEFISQFDMPAGSSLKKRVVIETGMPFIPAMFEPILKSFTPDVPSSLSGRPRQEDTQEFLGFVIEKMHDEMLKLDGHLESSGRGTMAFVSSSEEEGWETVGPKNTTTVTRTQSFIPSKLSAIFGGQLRSVVKARGNKPSATVQPFLLLHLDIFSEAVHTVEDAFRLFSVSETLEGYKTSGAGKDALVSASKSIKIQTLPKIMILHLMRFNYGSQGSTKLHRPVHFPLELVLGRDLLVSPTSEGRRYELVATITHHGRDPSKGHYTADTRNSDGQWLRYDDSSVTAVGTNKVLHDQAYVLFYRQV